MIFYRYKAYLRYAKTTIYRPIRIQLSLMRPLNIDCEGQRAYFKLSKIINDKNLVVNLIAESNDLAQVIRYINFRRK